jgi:hypothetical protein
MEWIGMVDALERCEKEEGVRMVLKLLPYRTDGW